MIFRKANGNVHIPGNTITSLWIDQQAAGCKIILRDSYTS